MVAHHPSDKGTPGESRGRKATGPRLLRDDLHRRHEGPHDRQAAEGRCDASTSSPRMPRSPTFSPWRFPCIVPRFSSHDSRSRMRSCGRLRGPAHAFRTSRRFAAFVPHRAESRGSGCPAQTQYRCSMGCTWTVGEKLSPTSTPRPRRWRLRGPSGRGRVIRARSLARIRPRLPSGWHFCPLEPSSGPHRCLSCRA